MSDECRWCDMLRPMVRRLLEESGAFPIHAKLTLIKKDGSVEKDYECSSIEIDRQHNYLQVNGAGKQRGGMFTTTLKGVKSILLDLDLGD